MTANDWLQHYATLRRGLLRSLWVFLGIFTLLFYFNTKLYHYLALPFLEQLPQHGRFIATQVLTPFVAPLKLVFLSAGFLSLPFFLYEIWLFLFPGLYPQERRLLWPFFLSSTLLFYSGILFTYFVVLPLIFRFLGIITPAEVLLMPDMGGYLDFVFQSFITFGLLFETPVIILALNILGILSVETLTASRPYIIVLAFILGMLLTPPDVVSQVLLAIPLWLLFELGILLAKCNFSKGNSKDPTPK